MDEEQPEEASNRRWEAAQEGAERVREGDLAGAIAELEQVLSGDPDNEYAYHFLGAAHYEKGNFDKAMKAYLMALERAPNYLGSMVGLGHSLRLLGRYREALRVGRQILSRDMHDADGLYLMGLAHYSMGNEAEATRYLQAFLEANPEIEPAQEAHGLLEILAGQRRA